MNKTGKKFSHTRKETRAALFAALTWLWEKHREDGSLRFGEASRRFRIMTLQPRLTVDTVTGFKAPTMGDVETVLFRHREYRRKHSRRAVLVETEVTETAIRSETTRLFPELDNIESCIEFIQSCGYIVSRPL